MELFIQASVRFRINGIQIEITIKKNKIMMLTNWQYPYPNKSMIVLQGRRCEGMVSLCKQMNERYQYYKLLLIIKNDYTGDY